MEQTNKKQIMFTLLLLFMCVFNVSSQNNQGGNFTPSSGLPQRASAPIDAYSEVGDALQARYYANLQDYNNFLTVCLNNLDNDENSLKYKAQSYALANFKKKMNFYVVNDSWHKAQGDLLNYKRKYYEDYNLYVNYAEEECEKYLKNGDIAFNSSNYNEAISNYTKAIDVNSNYLYLNLKLGISYLSTNKIQKSLNCLNTFCGDYPNEPSGYYYRAMIHNLDNEPSKAIDELSKAIELDKNNYKYFLERGLRYSDIENYSQSINDFNKAIALKPNLSDGYYGRSVAKSWLDDVVGEINDIKKVLEIDPKHSMANNSLGWYYFKKGNNSLAISYLNKSILYNPSNPDVYDSRGEMKFKQSDFKGSITDMTKAIELNPESSNSYFIRGRSKYKLGDKNGACIDFSKSGELGNAEAYSFIKLYCK